MTTGKSLVHWHGAGVEGYQNKFLCPVVRIPALGEPAAESSALCVDAFTCDGSDTVLGHRLRPPELTGSAHDVHSVKLSIAAAAAADSGVVALAAAEAEEHDASIHLFAGLTTGQLWHLEVREHKHNGGQEQTQQALRISAASKKLLCCRMAAPVDMACCYARQREEDEGEPTEKSSSGSSKWSLILFALYSDGVVAVSWATESHITELPVVEGAERLVVSPAGGRVAVVTSKRRVVIFGQRKRQFEVLKDFAPLKLTGLGATAAMPAWVGEEKLLLPGATRLRSACSSSAWEQHDELPSLPESETSRDLLLLEHVDSPIFRAHLSGKTDGQEDTLFCGATVDGIVGVWRMQQAKPLILLRCGGDVPLMGLRCLPAAGSDATLVLLRKDGFLGSVSLSSEALIAASAQMDLDSTPTAVASGARTQSSTKANTPTSSPNVKAKRRTTETADANGKETVRSTSSVEAFLSREAAEASSAESESDAGEGLFDGDDASPLKSEHHGRRRRRRASDETDSSVDERERLQTAFGEEDREKPSSEAAAALASGVSALHAQLEEAQAMIKALMKKQHAATQTLIHPGGGPQPKDAGKPWCLFWTHFGHITKTVTADNSLLDIFNFYPGAASDGTAHRKLADLHNCSAAALCRAGVALAASGSSHSILEFRSFFDAGSWVKHFPEGEKLLAVAAGDSFVASVTEDRTLRIFTLGGILLYTADVFGRPVALCASGQLLVILTSTGCNEGALQLHCTLLHVHPCPPSPTSTFRLPISCIKRRLAAPPAAAASLPEIDIIHEGFFEVDAPLDWIGISPGGVPAVKDTSGVVRGLLPVASTNIGDVGYAFKWVKIGLLAEASTTSLLFPIVLDETKGELGVVRHKVSDGYPSFPDCSSPEAFFGYTMEQIPLRIPSPDLWSFPRWLRLLRQDRQLKGTGDGSGDAALVPWPQYDELRLQQEMAIRQLNHFVHTCGGSSAGEAECEAEAREAQKKYQILTKRHDKYCLRGFAKCTEDKRLHGVAKEMALRLKTENAPQHARSLIDSDTRLQAEQLREVLVWQEQKRHELGGGATSPAAAAVPADADLFSKENRLPAEQSLEQTGQEHTPARSPPPEKRSNIQKLIQWQQQQQEQEQRRKSCNGGLAALFDGQKRRASEAGTGRPAKKSFFQKAD